MTDAHYAFAQRYQQPIESAPEAVREAFLAAWSMSRAVAITDSARVCKTCFQCAADRFSIGLWDTTTNSKSHDGRLWQCMEELRMEIEK